MKKVLLLPLVIALVALVMPTKATSQTTERKQYTVYGAAFYNLENLFDTINANGTYDLEFSPKGARQWNSQKYWSKINNLAKCISHFVSDATPNGPAFVGVAEIENKSVLEDLVNAQDLKKWHLQIVHHDSPDRRGVDVSLLYNPRLFRVINVTNATLVVPDRPDLRTRDQMCVTGMLGNEKVSVIVNHWPSRLGGQEASSYLREAAAARVKMTIDSLMNDDPNQGVIIMGDLNDDPMDKSCAEVLGAKRKKELVEEGGLFNPWWDILAKGVGTLAYKGSWNLFDQIIISDYFLGDRDEGKLTYLRAQVHNFDFLTNAEHAPLRTYSAGAFLNGYSDHFPTEVFLVKRVK